MANLYQNLAMNIQIIIIIKEDSIGTRAELYFFYQKFLF